MKRVIVGTLMFIFLLFGVYAQSEWYLNKPIKDFKFKGLETVAESELRAHRQYSGRDYKNM